MAMQTTAAAAGVPETRHSPWATIYKRLRENPLSMLGAAIVLVFVLVALLAPWIATHDPAAQSLREKLQPPSSKHWFGTDELGRDIFSRVVYGARVSLQVGLAAVLIALVVGSLLGLLAGFYGGWIDSAVVVLIDILLAFPGVLLAIAIIAILGPGLENAAIAIGIYSVPQYARVMRGSVISVRNSLYVEASRAIGATDGRIMFRHILPNVLAPLIVLSTLRMASAILSASTLSFLGLGAQPPTPEWGAMLSRGRTYIVLAPYVMIFPGACLLLVILGFNLFGDALRDALDPRMRRSMG